MTTWGWSLADRPRPDSRGGGVAPPCLEDIRSPGPVLPSAAGLAPFPLLFPSFPLFDGARHSRSLFIPLA